MTSTGTGMNNCHGNAVRYSKKEDSTRIRTGRRIWPSSAARGPCCGSSRRRSAAGPPRGAVSSTAISCSTAASSCSATTAPPAATSRRRSSSASTAGSSRRSRAAAAPPTSATFSAWRTATRSSRIPRLRRCRSGRERHARARGQRQRLVRLPRIPREPLRPAARHPVGCTSHDFATPSAAQSGAVLRSLHGSCRCGPPPHWGPLSGRGHALSARARRASGSQAGTLRATEDPSGSPRLRVTRSAPSAPPTCRRDRRYREVHLPSRRSAATVGGVQRVHATTLRTRDDA